MAEALGEGGRAAGRAGKVHCGAFGMSNSCKRAAAMCSPCFKLGAVYLFLQLECVRGAPPLSLTGGVNFPVTPGEYHRPYCCNTLLFQALPFVPGFVCEAGGLPAEGISC